MDQSLPGDSLILWDDEQETTHLSPPGTGVTQRAVLDIDRIGNFRWMVVIYENHPYRLPRQRQVNARTSVVEALEERMIN